MLIEKLLRWNNSAWSGAGRQPCRSAPQRSQTASSTAGARKREGGASVNSGPCRPGALHGLFLFPVGDQGVTQGGLVPLEIAPAQAGFVMSADMTAMGGSPLVRSLVTFCRTQKVTRRRHVSKTFFYFRRKQISRPAPGRKAHSPRPPAASAPATAPRRTECIQKGLTALKNRGKIGPGNRMR